MDGERSDREGREAVRIEQLEYLDAIVRHGSMRRAGEALRVSQPALSEAIRNLERELGTELFERRRSGARISPAGRELLPYVVDVVDAVDRLRAAAGDRRGLVRTIRLGAVDGTPAGVLAQAVRDLTAEHPTVQVEVVGGRQDALQDALLEGTLDLGVVSLLDGDDEVPELSHLTLVRGRPGVCCRPDDPLAALDEVPLEALLHTPLVLLRPGVVMHRYVHRVLGARRPAVTWAADGDTMGRTLVAEGLGVTVLPDYAVVGDPLERAGLVTWRPLQDDGTRVSLVLQARRARHRPAAVRALEAALLDRATLAGRATRTRVPAAARGPRVTPVSRLSATGN